MKKANLGIEVIRLINKVLGSGMRIKELTRRIEYSEKWIYPKIKSVDHKIVNRIVKDKRYSDAEIDKYIVKIKNKMRED